MSGRLLTAVGAGTVGAYAATSDPQNWPFAPYMTRAIENAGLRMINMAERAKGNAAGAAAGSIVERELLQQMSSHIKELQDAVKNQRSSSGHTVIYAGGQGWKGTVAIVTIGAAGAVYLYLKVTGSSVWDLLPASRTGLSRVQEALQGSLQGLWAAAYERFEVLTGKSDALAAELSDARDDIGKVQHGVMRLDEAVDAMGHKVDDIGRMTFYQMELSKLIGRVVAGIVMEFKGKDTDDARQLAALANLDVEALRSGEVQGLLPTGGGQAPELLGGERDTDTLTRSRSGSGASSSRFTSDVSKTFPLTAPRADPRSSATNRTFFSSLFGGASSSPAPFSQETVSLTFPLTQSSGVNRDRPPVNRKPTVERVERAEGPPGASGPSPALRSAGSGRFTEFLMNVPPGQ